MPTAVTSSDNVPAPSRPTGPAASGETVTCQGERFRLFLSEATIRERVAQLGRRIDRDFEGEDAPILIGILNGAFIFMADLIRTLSVDCEVDFLKLSSYGADKVSSGEVKQLKRIDADLEGRHVIVVEDIVDTGLTMQFMLDQISEMGTASVRVATLLHKEEATRHELPLDYVGFKIPDLFVIGYGLDYGQLGRDFPAIYIQAEDPSPSS